MRRLPAPGALVKPLLTIALVAIAGAALVLRTSTALTGILALCVVTAILIFAEVIPRVFLASLAVVLAGYASFGRSFAYLGVPPVYVGELMLAFALVAAMASGSLLALLRSPVVWLVVAFSSLGRGEDRFPTSHRMASKRFGMGPLWAYSAFAIAVAACALSTRSVPRIGARLWSLGGLPRNVVAGRPAPREGAGIEPAEHAGHRCRAVEPEARRTWALHLAGAAA